MNFASLIKYIKDVAINNPLVKQAIDGDIYQVNSKENQYGIFCVTSDTVVRNDHTTTYNLTLFYVDRLLEDQSNKNVVQTDGIICIQSVCNFINQNNENIYINTPINYQLFTQRFTDQCAGAWAAVSIEVEDALGDCDLFYEGLLLDPTGGLSGTSVLDNYYNKAEVEQIIRNIEHSQLRGLNSDPSFQHLTKEEKYLMFSTVDVVSENTENIDVLQTNIVNKQDKNKVVTNVVVDNFISSSVYTEYPYEASITIPGVLSTHLGEVTYDLVDTLSTNFAPICETYDGGVKIFSKTNSPITIKTIIIFL